MAVEKKIVKLKVRTGLEASLPDLDIGEPALTTDTEKVFIGLQGTDNLELAKKSDVDTVTSQLADTIKRAIYVTESPFKALGGGSDETTKLQNAINSLPAIGGILVFPAGYTFKHRAELNFTGKSKVTIFGYGAILESFTDTPVTSGYGNLWFKDVNNIAIFGLEIRANGRSRLLPSTPAPSIENSAITIMNCSNVWIRDVIISEAVNDGIFSGGQPSDPYSDNVLIENITIDWTRRNGVSFNKNTNSRVVGGTIKNVGYNMNDASPAADPLSVSPMAAIDSENTAGDGINDNIHITGVTFINNYIDVEFYGGHTNSSIENIAFSTTADSTFANYGIVLQGVRATNPTYIPKDVKIDNVKGKKRTLSGSIYIDQSDDISITNNQVVALSGASIVDTANNNRTTVKGNIAEIGFIDIEGVGSIAKGNTLKNYSSASGFGIFATAAVDEVSDNTVVSTSDSTTHYQCVDWGNTIFKNNVSIGGGLPVYNMQWVELEVRKVGTSAILSALYKTYGTTANRPTENLYIGRPYFDTDLGKPISLKTVSPVAWVDGTGATV